MDKKKVQQLLSDEPDEIDVEAFAERLFLLDKLARAERQLADGQGIPHEQAKQKLAAWLKQRSSGRPSRSTTCSAVHHAGRLLRIDDLE